MGTSSRSPAWDVKPWLGRKRCRQNDMKADIPHFFSPGVPPPLPWVCAPSDLPALPRSLRMSVWSLAQSQSGCGNILQISCLRRQTSALRCGEKKVPPSLLRAPHTPTLNVVWSLAQPHSGWGRGFGTPSKKSEFCVSHGIPDLT